MKKTNKTLLVKGVLGASLITASAAAPATTVVSYDFEDSVGNFTNVVESKAAEVIAASAWSVNSSSVSNDGGDAGGNSESIKALWDSELQFFEFSFQIAPGLKLDLNQVSFKERFGGGGGGGSGGGGGPKKAFSNGWNLLVNGIERTSGPVGLTTEAGLNGATLTTDPFNSAILDTPLSVGNLTGTVTVRLTGDSPVPALKFDGNPFGTGDWRVDSFVLSGDFSPVPVPGGIWLLGSALAGLVARRKQTARC